MVTAWQGRNPAVALPSSVKGGGGSRLNRKVIAGANQCLATTTRIPAECCTAASAVTQRGGAA
jgi:hypothetical protein